ncbi:MAG TPA: TonB-dependent receptor [Povalibacter sp.]|nr:TonB-dependent receptor [Povalibacter sp.]
MKAEIRRALSRRHTQAFLALAGGATLVNTVLAQTPPTDQVEEVIVTGLRGSLQASMDIKREAVGVVDAISAEDIGKFPDANLSEALQRITGVSIDRRNGEGAQVTARGFGAQFNMVTLNGRQMPTADAFAGGAAIAGGIVGNTRAFNFSNLAAESISAVEVYKTGRADIATGGIGASINVRTARPFDNAGTVVNVGAKLVYDTTNRVGDDMTPEVSGIFSFADDDKTWGVGLSASYQRRDSGSSGSTVNDWRIQPWDQDMSVNGTRAPLYVDRNDTPYDPSDDEIAATVVNAPQIGQLYGIPNDIRYHFADRERERTNAQLTLQFAPIDALTFTADYTYALNELTEDRGDQTIWMQRNGFYYLEFDTDEQVATPVLLREYTGAAKDFGYEQQHREQKNELDSIGLNVEWQMSDRFKLALDVHDSKAKSLPNDSLTGGGETTFSLAGRVPDTCLELYGPNPNGGPAACRNASNFWTQEFAFNNGLPVAGRTLYPTQFDALAGRNGNSNYSFDESSLGTQILRVNYQDQVTELTQGRLDGTLEFEAGRLQFGVETRALDSRQRGSAANMTLGDWGTEDSGAVPDMVALLTPFSLVHAFDDFNPAGAPVGGWKGNANQLAQWAFSRNYRNLNWTEPSAPDGELRYNPGFAADNLVEEDTKAVYAQFSWQGDLWQRAANLVVGVRYEQTDVESTAQILAPTALLWQDDNDFQVQRPPLLPQNVQAVRETSDYDNVLPSIDFDISLTAALKARASYSTTIARAGFGQLAAGSVPGAPNGSTVLNSQANANANNPGLVPIESDNIDLSLEWYFADDGYVSVGFWDKQVKNFIGNQVTDEPLFGLLDQTAGPRAEAALQYLRTHGYAVNDSALFTLMAMIDNPGTFTDANGTWTGGAANYNGSNAQHVAFASRYDLLPNADDPAYVFAVSRPVNNKDANIYGWEFAGQYFFGDTGFGVLANYTIVRGDIGYNNASDPDENQFALLGLSDSANAVLMYEKYGVTVRLAYNWRDEFLSNINVGTSRSPIYVEEYDQLDLSIAYDFNDHLTATFEGLNITEEDVRWHGRSEKQMWFIEDQGARYALGARYRF